MKLTAHRTIPAALAVAVAAFLVSGIPRFKNAHHGLDAAIGEIVWIVFLAGLAAAVVLAAIALARTRRARA